MVRLDELTIPQHALSVTVCNVVSGGCLSTVMAAVPRDRSGVTSSENY